MKNVKRYAYLLLIPLIALLLGGCGELSKEEKTKEMKIVAEKVVKAEFCNEMIEKYYKKYEKESIIPFEYQLGKLNNKMNEEIEYVQKCKIHLDQVSNINRNLEKIIDDKIKSLEEIKKVEFLEEEYEKVRIEHRKMDAIFDLKEKKLILNFMNSDADLKYQMSQLICDGYKLRAEKEEAKRKKDEEKLKILKTKETEFKNKVDNIEANFQAEEKKLVEAKKQLDSDREKFIKEAYQKANLSTKLNPRDSDTTFIYYDVPIYDLEFDVKRSELMKYEEIINYFKENLDDDEKKEFEKRLNKFLEKTE